MINSNSACSPLQGDVSKNRFVYIAYSKAQSDKHLDTPRGDNGLVLVKRTGAILSVISIITPFNIEKYLVAYICVNVTSSQRVSVTLGQLLYYNGQNYAIV